MKSKKFFYIFILLGAGLRIIEFLFNRSVWFDEALLSLNIINRDFAGLLKPLDNNQVAPILFLFIEKTCTLLFGNSEQSLRLFPLVCGILSLPLIHKVTLRITQNIAAAMVALFLFATSAVLIYFANEVKQYECDVFCALLLSYILIDIQPNSTNNKRFIVAGIIGSVLVFLSNITVLVLFSMVVYHLLKHKTKLIKQPLYLLMLAMWAIAFGIYFALFIHNNPHRDEMVAYWAGSFMPLTIFSSAFVHWFTDQFASLFNTLFSNPLMVVYFVSLIVFIFKKHYTILYFLLFPMLLHFVLSGFKLYPFETRLILYLMVFITPGIAMGIVTLGKYLSNRNLKPVAAAVASVILIPLIRDLEINFHYKKEEMKESISYLESNYTAPQRVYVYYGALPATEFYSQTKLFTHSDIVRSGTGNRNDMTKYVDEIKKITGDVWLLFAHVHPDNHGEEDFIIKELSKTHKIVKRFNTVGSSAYLFKVKR